MAGGEIHDRTYKGRIDGKAIYMTHVPRGVNQVTSSEAYDLVVYGHTHRQDIQRVGKTLLVNPGAARNWMGNSGQAVIVDLADMTATAVSLA